MAEEQDEPIRLMEDEETGDRFLVYSTDKGLRIDIRFEGESLWMTQAQIGQLFGRDVSTVSRHIGNILDEGELDESGSLQKVQTTTGRPATIYSLDMVISVGYRVSSAQATLFRRWATSILVQYAKKGFVIDAARLKETGNIDRVRELREISCVRRLHKTGGHLVGIGMPFQLFATRLFSSTFLILENLSGACRS